MLFRKNKLDKLSKNISAHDRAHDLLALISGAFFDPIVSARSLAGLVWWTSSGLGLFRVDYWQLQPGWVVTLNFNPVK